QAGNIFGTILRDSSSVPAIERDRERLATGEDERPREARLEAFEHEPFEELLVVVTGTAPFFIVVGGIAWPNFAPAHADEVLGLRRHVVSGDLCAALGAIPARVGVLPGIEVRRCESQLLEGYLHFGAMFDTVLHSVDEKATLRKGIDLPLPRQVH